jgi:hypothetical protein
MKTLEKKLTQISADTYSAWIYRILGTGAMLVVAYIFLHWLVGNAGWGTAAVSASCFIVALLLYYTRQSIVLVGCLLALGGCFVAIMAFWQMYLALGFAPPEAASALFLVVGTIITATILALRVPRHRPARTVTFLFLTIIVSNIFWLPLSTNIGYAAFLLPIIIGAGLVLLTPFTLGRFVVRQLTARKRLKRATEDVPSSLVRYLTTQLGEDYTVLGKRKVRYGFRGRHLSVADAIVIGPTGVYTICQHLPHGSMSKDAAGVWKIDGTEFADYLRRPVSNAQAIAHVTCGTVSAHPIAAATPKTRLPDTITRTSLLAPSRTDIPITTARGAVDYIMNAKTTVGLKKVSKTVRRVLIHTDPV